MSITKLFVIMGVSGTGKTTIGKLLSQKMDVPFFDGDDFHPASNIAKMASGQPLNDEDRHDWLLALNQLLKNNGNTGAIVACSALKSSYRKLLRKGLDKKVHFIYLKGSFDEVKTRLEQRKGHFMPLELLRSQFDTLEEPKKAITLSIMESPEKMVNTIIERFTQDKSNK